MKKKMINHYDPLFLTRCARPVGNEDVFVVDRNCIEDIKRFYAVLTFDYKWRYDTAPEFTSVYFQVEGNTIYGGVFNTFNNTKRTRVPIASTTEETAYCYTYDEINDIKSRLSNDSSSCNVVY